MLVLAMKINLNNFTVFLLLFFISCNSRQENNPEEERMVYLCESPRAYSFHFDSKCPALKKCSHTVSKTTASLAKKHRRRLCGWEANGGIIR